MIEPEIIRFIGTEDLPFELWELTYDISAKSMLRIMSVVKILRHKSLFLYEQCYLHFQGKIQ